ncbi:hypothetical protein SDC9_108695 [bioreactor metagenome]|uniref:Uncharacterized protein n=1 Tax=bioreactor metagenome TaxID=1076179 RepID=A0A645B8U0_9ZZZZ
MNTYINKEEVKDFLMGISVRCSKGEVKEFLKEFYKEYYDELEKSSDTVTERKFQCERYGFTYAELYS